MSTKPPGAPTRKADDSYLRAVHSQVLQAFFRRVKTGEKPGFRGRGCYDSLTYPYVGLQEDRLYIRSLEGIPKTCTIGWYASISCRGSTWIWRFSPRSRTAAGSRTPGRTLKKVQYRVSRHHKAVVLHVRNIRRDFHQSGAELLDDLCVKNHRLAKSSSDGPVHPRQNEPVEGSQRSTQWIPTRSAPACGAVITKPLSVGYSQGP